VKLFDFGIEVGVSMGLNFWRKIDFSKNLKIDPEGNVPFYALSSGFEVL
jgi:hypothetical protein